VIETLAAHAPQKSFAYRIHQRRLHSGVQDANPGAPRDAVEHWTELVVAIIEDERRTLPERRRVAKLLRCARLRGSARHRDVHDALGVHLDDEAREDRTEPDIVGLQEIPGPDRVVAQECPPALSASRSCRPLASHVPLDCALRDSDAELQELASNPFGSQEPVLGHHATDEGDDIRNETRFAWTAGAGFPTPEESESLPVPSQ
jgi:hypothetical protein